jgi:hypothetical protein
MKLGPLQRKDPAAFRELERSIFSTPMLGLSAIFLARLRMLSTSQCVLWSRGSSWTLVLTKQQVVHSIGYSCRPGYALTLVSASALLVTCLAVPERSPILLCGETTRAAINHMQLVILSKQSVPLWLCSASNPFNRSTDPGQITEGLLMQHKTPVRL